MRISRVSGEQASGLVGGGLVRGLCSAVFAAEGSRLAKFRRLVTVAYEKRLPPAGSTPLVFRGSTYNA